MSCPRKRTVGCCIQTSTITAWTLPEAIGRRSHDGGRLLVARRFALTRGEEVPLFVEGLRPSVLLPRGVHPLAPTPGDREHPRHGPRSPSAIAAQRGDDEDQHRERDDRDDDDSFGHRHVSSRRSEGGNAVGDEGDEATPVTPPVSPPPFGFTPPEPAAARPLEWRTRTGESRWV